LETLQRLADRIEELSSPLDVTCKAQKLYMRFNRWLGEHWWLGKDVDPRWTIKSEIECPIGKEPTVAEIAILHLLEADGWQGRWVNNFAPFARRFMVGLPVITEPVPLEPEPLVIYQQIVSRNGGIGGFWDVFAWRGSDYVFVESKGRGDTISDAQWQWLAAASSVVPQATFFIVEWRYATPA
jgi:hypothetical protein